MRFVYSLVLYLLIPYVVLRLLWRAVRAPAYLHRWAERFGFFAPPAEPASIWVHAVSVGEVQAAAPLIVALRQRYPQRSVLVTTMTPTGSERVQDLFGDRVFHVYAPYDLPDAVRRFLDKVRPSLALIMETELWPNLFSGCRARGVPIVVANARLSSRSMEGYRKVAPLARETLAAITVIAAQGRSDAERFRTLGADPGAVQVTGSIKFDVKLPASLREQAEVLRRQLGTARPVWIAASTHEGEDERILEAFALIRKSASDCLLVLVPRHPERFSRVASLCRRAGLNVVLRSEGTACESSTHVYLGDTLGELPLMYAAADVAFVGGSLVSIGGHNLLEPAALGLPVVVGPHTFHFEEITERLLEVDGARQVDDVHQLAGCVEALLRDANLRHAVGENAKAFVEKNKGALERLLQIVEGVGERQGGGSGSNRFCRSAPARE